jgi:hypothetical protein
MLLASQAKYKKHSPYYDFELSSLFNLANDICISNDHLNILHEMKLRYIFHMFFA